MDPSPASGRVGLDEGPDAPALSFFTIDTLAALRADVHGESLWTKAQKEATTALYRYARSGEAADYQEFHRLVDVTLGDRQAREELQSPEPDLERVRDGFLRGGRGRPGERSWNLRPLAMGRLPR